MTLVATLLVRDEADIVAHTIRHLLAQGVATIIAMDNGSLDGTVEILEAYERTGVLELHHQPDQDYRQAEWVTFMARRAATEFDASWVLNVDADEFWVPQDRSTTLDELLSAQAPQVTRIRAMRTDMEGLPYLESRPWPRRLRWRNLNTVNERGGPLRPKMCHRADPDVQVSQGNHRAEGPLLGEITPPGPIDIYHVPRRSWKQFRTKIDNGGSAYAANTDLPPGAGWHWREDYERLLNGTLKAEYRKRSFTVLDLMKGVRAGTLVRDRWLEKELARLEAAEQD